MDKQKLVALVAHDNMKKDLAEWVEWNCAVLALHPLVCTGTTGRMVERTLRGRSGDDCNVDSLDIRLLRSGPLGGDQQLGSLIVDGRISALIFFCDPMAALVLADGGSSSLCAPANGVPARRRRCSPSPPACSAPRRRAATR